MSDQAVLAAYVEVWWQAVLDLTALLDEVPAEQWDSPTDLAGWDVRACVAHTAHLERVLATGVEEQADVGEPPHVSGMGFYTEIGVVNRRDHSPAQLVEEILVHAGLRHEALLADPPTDAQGSPPVVPGGIGWSWATLLRNRPLDVWMHEQDVRRAVGRPGGMDSAAAVHVGEYLGEAFGFVLAKRVGAAPGTTAVLRVAGHEPFAFTVNDAGRGLRLPEVPERPDVVLEMDRESFVVLAGGRRSPVPGAVTVTGDQELGALLLSRMATTP